MVDSYSGTRVAWTSAGDVETPPSKLPGVMVEINRRDRRHGEQLERQGREGPRCTVSLHADLPWKAIEEVVVEQHGGRRGPADEWKWYGLPSILHTTSMFEERLTCSASFIRPDGRLPDCWGQLGELLTAGVRGVEAGKGDLPRPAIMVHIDQGGDVEKTQWSFDHLIVNHVPFDVIGQSYYPWWQGSLEERRNLAFMATRYKKPIIVVETAYDWRNGENFSGKKREFAESPDGQRAFLSALVGVVKSTPGGLGKGLCWWEPMAEGPIAKRAIFDDDHNACRWSMSSILLQLRRMGRTDRGLSG